MRHPFAEETIEKKYAYVIGIAVAAFENGEISEKQQSYLKKLAKNLALSDEDLNKILSLAKKYQVIKNKIIYALDTPYKKYCFLMELYHMFYETNREDKQPIRGIDEFAELLGIKQPEFNQVKQTFLNIEYKNKYYVAEINKRCDEDQFFLGEDIVKYFSSEEECAVLEERVLKKGEELIISERYKLSGKIIIQEGAKLIFDHADVEIDASIQVNGGCLEIRNSNFLQQKVNNHSMFIVVDAAVHIENSCFNAQNHTSIWCHINGELTAENCTFTCSRNRPCMTLWECPTRIKLSQFKDCQAKDYNGGAVYTNSNIEITDTHFEQCSADKGAAVYRFTTFIPWVKTRTPKGEKSNKSHTDESKMLTFFGKKVDFIPVPKSLKQIAYPVMLKGNIFTECTAYKMGIICAYKHQIIVNENNTFEKCKGQNIFYYE